MVDRKKLDLKGLLSTVSACVDQEKLVECSRSSITWSDVILSGLAVFTLKYPSLLQYDKAVKAGTLKQNLKRLFGVEQPPSDTCMRERLDKLDTKHLRRPFKKIFADLQRGKALEPYRFMDGYYIVAADGTGQYSSQSVHCEQCCSKKHRSGEVTYYHQMFGGAIVHPDQSCVIPLAPEPITKQDGENKNDCERNASKRFFEDLRREHPHLKILVVEDALASNYPHLSLLDKLGMGYVIGIKPGDHKYLFDWIADLPVNQYEVIDEAMTSHRFEYYSDVPLSETAYEYRVNVICYRETRLNGKEQKFSWVTKEPVSEQTLFDLMRAGRSRWSIENETFNTLKNQGYHFEHNYGHGNKNLCSVFTMLMTLSFLIDQVQQLTSSLYRKARATCGGRLSEFYNHIRTMFFWFSWQDWHGFFTHLSGTSRSPPISEMM